MNAHKLEEAQKMLQAFGLPPAQHNERTALCLLALCDVKPNIPWAQASAPLIGITPIMNWAREHYQKNYAPNTRETVRRQSMHQLVDAGIALYNPDVPERPVNSPNAVYQIAPPALVLARSYGTPAWDTTLAKFLSENKSLAARYAKERAMHQIPVHLPQGEEIILSPGGHSELIKAIIEAFAPRFAPGSKLLYAGDTGEKWGYFNENLLRQLGVTVDAHGKMPDVVLYFEERQWLLLVEAVTSHGPVDSKRHEELAKIFAKAKPGIVYVTAFPTRAVMAHYLGEIAWETEVWVADASTHLIHFNGERFLGPYSAT